jgi:hypothetical protein
MFTEASTRRSEAHHAGYSFVFQVYAKYQLIHDELKMLCVLHSRAGHACLWTSGLAKHFAAPEPASVMLADTWIKVSAKPAQCALTEVTNFSDTMTLWPSSTNLHLTIRRWQLAHGSSPEHLILLWRHGMHLRPQKMISTSLAKYTTTSQTL